jgi:pyrimidine 5'-nucleotidase
MMVQALFFDLDETLYPPGNGIWEKISERMEAYMVEQLHLPADQVKPLRQKYFETYGTTLRGLQAHHQVEPLEFLTYVHDIPLNGFLLRDPALRSLLQSLPYKKWVCTNADRGHAQKVMDYLEVADCFEGIIDILKAQFHPKPENQYYQAALSLAGGLAPQECILLDDQPRNLAPAQAMGFTTVLVRPNISECPFATRIVADLHELPAVFPELWTNSQEAQDD